VLRFWQQACRREILCQPSNISENMYYHCNVFRQLISVCYSRKLSDLGQECRQCSLRPRSSSSYKVGREEMLIAIDQNEDVLASCLSKCSVSTEDRGEERGNGRVWERQTLSASALIARSCHRRRLSL
jgi:hypothetical protein